MAVEAIRKAILDAGLRASDVDGMMSYQNGDSTPANWVAPDLGIRLNFYMDVVGGGSSTEALIGLSMGAIEAGMCRTVAIFRSMNGYTEFRIGGTGARGAHPRGRLRLPPGPFGMARARPDSRRAPTGLTAPSVVSPAITPRTSCSVRPESRPRTSTSPVRTMHLRLRQCFN